MFLQFQFHRKGDDGNAVSLVLRQDKTGYTIARFVRFGKGESYILLDRWVYKNKFRASYEFVKKVESLQYDPDWVVQPNENLIANPDNSL